MLVNEVSSGSGNGLSPVKCQAITWTNADLLLIELSGTNFSEIQIKIEDFSFIKKNAFENVVCEMTAILSSGHEFNAHWISIAG